MHTVEPLLHKILEKLQHDPLSITSEDAQCLKQNPEASSPHLAKIIAAVEALTVANQEIHEKTSTLHQASHTPLLKMIDDLKVAVDVNPAEVTSEALKTTQSIVSKMQKIIGQTNAPHPELEAELQKEFARIVPKVEQGTVTKEEADHLHSLEARAHGHTEKGGLTAVAQSVVAKRERALSVTQNASGGRIEQSAKDKAQNLKIAELTVAPKLENEPQNITKEDAAWVQSREHRALGHVKEGSVAAEAQHFADIKPAAGLD